MGFIWVYLLEPELLGILPPTVLIGGQLVVGGQIELCRKVRVGFGPPKLKPCIS